jgi:hypothetical protein
LLKAVIKRDAAVFFMTGVGYLETRREKKKG